MDQVEALIRQIEQRHHSVTWAQRRDLAGVAGHRPLADPLGVSTATRAARPWRSAVRTSA
ncbi:hypothetical protein CCR81_03660 [Halorhodospira halophila]|nr:hypothetical protein [Halorhodospira halophila]